MRSSGPSLIQLPATQGILQHRSSHKSWGPNRRQTLIYVAASALVGAPDIWPSPDLPPLWFNGARSPKARSTLVQELTPYDGFTAGLIQLIATPVGASSPALVGLPNRPSVQTSDAGTPPAHAPPRRAFDSGMRFLCNTGLERQRRHACPRYEVRLQEEKKSQKSAPLQHGTCPAGRSPAPLLQCTAAHQQQRPQGVVLPIQWGIKRSWEGSSANSLFSPRKKGPCASALILEIQSSSVTG